MELSHCANPTSWWILQTPKSSQEVKGWLWVGPLAGDICAFHHFMPVEIAFVVLLLVFSSYDCVSQITYSTATAVSWSVIPSQLPTRRMAMRFRLEHTYVLFQLYNFGL